MNVSLTPELEKLVHRKLETGRYASVSEVIREALRYWSGSNTWCPRLTAAMILSGSLVQRKGRGSSLA